MVNIVLPLTDQEAWDLAQLVKRFGFVDAKNNAANDFEAQRMLDVIVKIQRVLTNAGVQPR